MKNQTIQQFCDELGSDSPTPGGGAVAGLTGALSAALSSMVSSLGLSSTKYEAHQSHNKETQAQSREMMGHCFDLMEEDAKAFDGFMAALKMPKTTDEEKTLRKEQLALATKNAIVAPMQTMRSSVRLAQLALAAAEYGNKGAITDAAIAAHLAKVTAKAASYNVRINLKSLRDDDYAQKCIDEMRFIEDEIEDLCEKVDRLTDEQID